MFINKRSVGVIAGMAALVVSAAPSFAAIDKCAKLIDGESIKMQSATIKGFAKCVDAYYKDSLKPPTPPFSKAAAACEKELTKIIAAGGALDKSISKLASQAPKTCTDADLLALGHMPTTAPFGNRWAQFQGVAALQFGYEQILISARTWGVIMDTLGNTGSCPSCKKLALAPCQLTACKLINSAAIVDLNGLNLTVTLDGESTLRACDVSSIISSTAGVVFAMGLPGEILRPAAVGGIATSCTKTLSAEGIVQCGSGAQTVDYQTCIDHNTGGVSNAAGTTTSGDCTGTACQASSADKDNPSVTNGGACITLSPKTGGAGDAFINLASQILLHAPGSNCTDAPVTVSAPTTTPLTTGTASALVKNADDGDATAQISSTPQTGVKFNCATIVAGYSPGVRLVGAFPSLNGLTVGNENLDDVVGFALECVD